MVIRKNDFDKWVLTQKDAPPHWYGLKFFNVYGPNEYHKSRMASVIFHAYHQFKNTGKVKLFRSHKAEYKDGEQIRDFIYVKDVIRVIEWLIENHPESGIYNLGTGKARSFYDLAAATAKAMDMPLVIDWIDIPEDIREKYQYFTEADMQKLLSAGYNNTFYNLEEGIC
jgi:ADP-L-glycero-D-manno-heptose 6-epimerase